MFDTVKGWLSKDEINDSGYFKRVPTILTNVSEHYRNEDCYITGSYKNLNIIVGIEGISINGSLNKLWHNDNFNKFTRQQTELCIKMLSDVFSINFDLAKITRLDIAHNFIMDEQPESYYNLLGDCIHYNRLVQPNSIYYTNSLRTKLFYNKIAEAKAKRLEIPQIWHNKNVLRYELRYCSRIAKQLNRSEIKALNLYDESFYISIIDNWIKEYFQIKKNKLLKPNVMNLTQKTGKDYLLSACIKLLGQNEIMTMTKEWKQHFTTPKEAQRFNKSLQNLKGLTEQSPLIEELDKKISSIKEYYR